MLQNLLICVNAVVPSFIFLLVGIILRLTKVAREEDVNNFTQLIFLSLYPFIMFENIYGKNIAEHMDFKLGAYALGFTVLQFIIGWVYVCKIEKDNFNRGSMIQAMYRSNYVILGFPIAINLFGKGNVAAVAIVMMLVVPFYNASAVIIFERFRGGKVNIGGMIKKIITNPIIDGGIAAFVLMWLGVVLPQSIDNSIESLADAASPIAMILLGASLNLKSFSSDRRRIAICTLGKLVIFPLIGISGAILIGLRDAPLVAVVLAVATPVALASYAMASSMGGNGKLAGEIVVVSTLVSCVTIPLWLFLLKTMGMF